MLIAPATGLPWGSMPSTCPPVVENGPTGVHDASLASSEMTPEKVEAAFRVGATSVAVSMLAIATLRPPATKVASVSVTSTPGALTSTSMSAPPSSVTWFVVIGATVNRSLPALPLRL